MASFRGLAGHYHGDRTGGDVLSTSQRQKGDHWHFDTHPRDDVGAAEVRNENNRTSPVELEGIGIAARRGVIARRRRAGRAFLGVAGRGIQRDHVG
jgi:hypothetical protein